nr:PepSY domain-containing protein [Stenotrophomonas sp. A5586]
MRVLDGNAREQQAVRQAVQQGRYVPLETVVRDALKRYPGKLLEVELDDDTYEIEILAPNGKVMELDYDARNGRLLKMEED